MWLVSIDRTYMSSELKVYTLKVANKMEEIQYVNLILCKTYINL